jgi:lysophospholipase L1-like esterase
MSSLLMMANKRRPAYIFDGDSLTAGSGASDEAHRWPNVFMSARPGVLWTNYAVAGAGINSILADAVEQVDPTYAGNPQAVVMCWIGANNQSGDMNTIYNSIVSYHQGRRAAGHKTMAFTVLPRGDAVTYGGTTAVWDANRMTLNGMIRAGWASWADGLVDVAADGRLQNFNNATYFGADLVHLKDAGYAVIAALAGGAAPQAQSNLLSNYDFEAGAGDTFTNWSKSVGTGGTIEQETTLVNGGARAIKLTQGSAGSVYLYQVKTLIPERKYRLTAYGRGNGSVNSAKIRFTENGGAYRATSLALAGSAGGYGSASVEWTVPADCAGGGSVMIQLVLSTAIQGESCYFDDARLEFVN